MAPLNDWLVRWQLQHPRRDGYLFAVQRLGAFLGDLRAWMVECGTLLAADSLVPLAAALRELLDAFEAEARRVPAGDDSLAARARSELHPLLSCSPFAARAFAKPLGFAGDYELVNMMLGVSSARPTDLFPRFLDDVLTSLPVVQAHGNRIRVLEAALSEECTRVSREERLCALISVGCGPALEVQRFLLRPEARRACLELVDFDPETLEHARVRTAAVLAGLARPPSLRIVQQSVEQLLEQPLASDARRGAYDFVYCTGLFDYFSDDVCEALVARFLSWLRVDGGLLVSNVHPGNPHRLCMEHLVDWRLIYRDERQLERLVPESARSRLFKDATGLNVFASIRAQR